MLILVCVAAAGTSFLPKKADLDSAPDNFLYDKDTMRLTALLDFDFSHIATFADEFFRSLCADIG